MSNYLTILAVSLALCLSVMTTDISADQNISVSICGDPGSTTLPPPQQ